MHSVHNGTCPKELNDALHECISSLRNTLSFQELQELEKKIETTLCQSLTI